MTVVNDCQLLVSQLIDQLIEARKKIEELRKLLANCERDLWQL